MSIEVAGFDPEDTSLTNTISVAGGQLCAGQGIGESDAFSTGVSGAEYGAAVVFTALRQMGEWPPEGFDANDFEVKAREIVAASLGDKSTPTQEQDEGVDPIAKIFETRRVAQDRAKIYGSALDELIEASSQLRGSHLIISGVPYAQADSPIYGERERFRLTEQQVRVRDAYVTDDRRSGDERPNLHITVTLPYGRQNSHEPLTFYLHELDKCVTDELPAQDYYTGEIYLD